MEVRRSKGGKTHLVGRSAALPYHLVRIGVHMQITHKFLFFSSRFVEWFVVKPVYNNS